MLGFVSKDQSIRAVKTDNQDLHSVNIIAIMYRSADCTLYFSYSEGLYCKAQQWPATALQWLYCGILRLQTWRTGTSLNMTVCLTYVRIL